MSILIGLRVLQGIAVESTPISTNLIRDEFPRTKFPIGMGIYLCFLFWRHGANSYISADPGWQGNFYFRAAIAAVLTFVSCVCVCIHLDETQKIHEEKVSNAITATLNLY